jgi:opacity protein-like surface antigen
LASKAKEETGALAIRGVAPGFTAGVGAEWKLTDHLSLRGEYRYLHFDFSRGDSREQRFDVPGAFGFNHALFNTNAYQTSDDLHLAKLGIAYGF